MRHGDSSVDHWWFTCVRMRRVDQIHTFLAGLVKQRHIAGQVRDGPGAELRHRVVLGLQRQVLELCVKLHLVLLVEQCHDGPADLAQRDVLGFVHVRVQLQQHLAHVQPISEVRLGLGSQVVPATPRHATPRHATKPTSRANHRCECNAQTIQHVKKTIACS
jgi:hypothetical protein